MIQNATFQRKVIYLAIIALLLIPLYWIGHPAAGDPTDANSKPGGRLAQLRSQYDLSQAELGEIDPASESMKLATLGMRGVAANILWTKANQYKKKENWEQLVAVVNQMAKLQPNYVTVWEFQSHNLSYNVSVEHDDYRFRYLWVKKGIDFLIEGTRYNRKEPRLFWTVGWYTGQKFGRADEVKQFRRMFRVDNDFHAELNQHVVMDESRGADGLPDNWLVSRLWYGKGYNIVDTQGVPIRGKSPHIFYSDGPKARMNYASAIESEGYLDEKAEYAWQQALDEWLAFGDRQVSTTTGLMIRLNDRESLLEEVDELNAELDEVAPGVRDEIAAEKRARLSDAERAALDTGFDMITDPDVYSDFVKAQQKMAITYSEIAERAPESVRAKARRVAMDAQEAEITADWIDRYRSNVNFVYWRTRCEIEQKPEAVRARNHVYQANQLMNSVQLESAKREFELAWEDWSTILDENPEIVEQLMADDLLEDIQKYIELLGQLDQKLPADFKLLPVLEANRSLPEYLMPDAAAQPSETSAPADESPNEQPADTEAPTATEQPADAKAKPEDAKPGTPTADASVAGDAKPEDAKSDDASKEDAEPADAPASGDVPVDPPKDESAAKPAEASGETEDAKKDGESADASS